MSAQSRTGERVPRFRRPRKVCVFCKTKTEHIDYKDVGLLQRHVNERGKMLPKRATGNCARHQRRVTLAIKRARELALLPYVRS